MNIQTIDGKISIKSERSGVSSPLTAYICRPNAKIICRMNGIEGMSVKAKFIDVSEINFTVTKYIVSSTSHKLVKNYCYDYLHSFCCVLVPELGKYGLFRINEEPTINAQNSNEESKSFTAHSYESILQYEYLSNFKVNQGTEDSLEMFDVNLSPSGAPIERIKLYNPEDESLSLLNLALYDDLYGWEVMHVDSSVANKEASFLVDRKSVYTFLREDVQKAFRCIIDFDPVHKYINVYDIENVGNNTNIVLSFSRFIQQINIKPSTADIFTVFNVAGGNGLDIARVNFGSNKIINLDYPITFMSSDIQSAYEQYKLYRESRRSEYTTAYNQYAVYLGKRNSILDRQPLSDTENNWMSSVYYSLADLQSKLADYQAVVAYIEGLYTSGGTVDYAELDISPDAAEYYSYKNVVIPDIQAAIDARGHGESTADTVDVTTQWQLYGLNDLEVKLNAYTNMKDTLAEQGYTRPWSSTDDAISEDTWNAHYAEYTSYSGYVTTLTALIADRNTKLAAVDAQIASLQSQLTTIASSVRLEAYLGVTMADTIKLLYKESDYSDENYLITDYDTEADITAEAELLYQAAVERLEVESRPQLTWAISSDSLYAIPEFAKLRDSLQNGDYCTIAYGGHNRMVNNYVVEYKSRESLFLKQDGAASLPDSYYKLRVVEIDFDGLDLDKSFGLVFSDVVATTKELNDFESLLGDFVSSKTNAIKALTLAASAANSSDIAQRIMRPYIEALQLQIENLKAQNIIVDDLEAIKITATQIHGGELTIGGLNNTDGVITVCDADGNQVGQWTKDGLMAIAGTIGGWIIGASALESADKSGTDIGGNTRTGKSSLTGDGLEIKGTSYSTYNPDINLTDWSYNSYPVWGESYVDPRVVKSNVVHGTEKVVADGGFWIPSRNISKWYEVTARKQIASSGIYFTLYAKGDLSLFWLVLDGTTPAWTSGALSDVSADLTDYDPDATYFAYQLQPADVAPPTTIWMRDGRTTGAGGILNDNGEQIQVSITSGGQIVVNRADDATTSGTAINANIFWAHI